MKWGQPVVIAAGPMAGARAVYVRTTPAGCPVVEMAEVSAVYLRGDVVVLPERSVIARPEYDWTFVPRHIRVKVGDVRAACGKELTGYYDVDGVRTARPTSTRRGDCEACRRAVGYAR